MGSKYCPVLKNHVEDILYDEHHVYRILLIYLISLMAFKTFITATIIQTEF